MAGRLQLRGDVDDSCPLDANGERQHTYDYSVGGCRQIRKPEITANLGWAMPGTGSALVMAKGERVLMLLPEIALTPQMRKNFSKRFGNKVAVIHSGQTPKSREIAWNRAYQNKISILIGPRSTIFAPIENLGLIILDEEHEPSYKQENHPRYLTHVVAEHRAKTQNARLIYGSATPGLEVFYRAKNEKLKLLQLKERVNQRPLPEVELVDMRNHYESEIGHFKGAVTPDVDTFRDSLDIIENDLKQHKEDKNLVMYCTGGIRCEKASAYYKHKGFKNVYQLEGGIIEYTRQIKEEGLENKFLGKNFVFDERRAERISDDIVSKCHQCGVPCDTHVNCKNKGCHLLFIQCEACQEKMLTTCSDECKKIVQLPEEEQKKLRSGKAISNKIFRKGRSNFIKKITK